MAGISHLNRAEIAMRVIDSHTEGEPTRVIIEGGPDLGASLRERMRRFQDSADSYRRMAILEPRDRTRWSAPCSANR